MKKNQNKYTTREEIFQLTQQRKELNLKIFSQFGEDASSMFHQKAVRDDWNVSIGGSNEVTCWYENIHGDFTNSHTITFSDSDRINARWEYELSAGNMPCLFGEHQLKPHYKNHRGFEHPKNARVCLFEDEITAVLLCDELPLLFVASGDHTAVNEQRLQVLSGRDVCVVRGRHDHEFETFCRVEDMLERIGARIFSCEELL